MNYEKSYNDIYQSLLSEEKAGSISSGSLDILRGMRAAYSADANRRAHRHMNAGALVSSFLRQSTFDPLNPFHGCYRFGEYSAFEVDRKTGRGWLRRAAEKYGQQYLDDRNRERRVSPHDDCQECGTPLPPGHGPNALFCDSCGKLHAAYRAYKARTSAAVSYADWKSARFCFICGKPLENVKSRFCPDCRKIYKRFRELRQYRKKNGLPEIFLDDYLKGVKK